MWEKFKAGLGSMVGLLLIPFLAVIYYLSRKNQQLTNQVEDGKAANAMATAVAAQQAAKETADAKVKDLNTLINDYAKSHPKPE